jgi:hypothetical protein
MGHEPDAELYIARLEGAAEPTVRIHHQTLDWKLTDDIAHRGKDGLPANK